MKTGMALILFGLLAAPGCGFDVFAWDSGIKGSGTVQEEIRELADFDEVVLDISADVIVSKGSVTTCTVIADDNVLPLILTEVAGNTLRIHSKGSFSTSSDMRVVLETSHLTRAHLKGSGSIILKNISEDNLDLKISGSGDIVADGKAIELTATVNGSGDILADGLDVQRAAAFVNGSGDIHLQVSDELKAEVRGSGDIIYKGNPEKKQTAVRGSGEIKSGR